MQSILCKNKSKCGSPSEVSIGLAIVFHEIETNAVGIQGAGFFTISYSFIGTVRIFL
jgi:hypothetical protein